MRQLVLLLLVMLLLPVMAQAPSFEDRFNQAWEIFGSGGDPQETYAILQQLSDEGYDKAAIELAYGYIKGYEGLEKDSLKAHALVKKSVEKGSAEAMAVYAHFLRDGVGCVPDTLAAIRYDKMGAEKGNAECMNNYALSLLKGHGSLQPDTISAIGWFRRAAEKDMPYAQWMLGLYYAQVDNDQEARYWLKRGAENHSPQCINALGECYREGNLGLEKNENKALQYFEQATEEFNYEPSIMSAARMYHAKGMVDKERELYKKAADLGNMEAWLNYAESFIGKDDKIAISLLMAILDTKLSDIRPDQVDEMKWIVPWVDYRVGLAYYLGKGVQQDKKKGAQIIYYWADEGLPMAQDAIKKLNIPRP